MLLTTSGESERINWNGDLNRVDEAVPLGSFLREHGAAQPGLIANQIFPNQLRLDRQLRRRQPDAERCRHAFSCTVDLEAHAAVTNLNDARRRIFDAGLKPSDNRLAPRRRASASRTGSANPVMMIAGMGWGLLMTS
jgi:hypothetical protein